MDDSRDNVREPDTINGALLCREENLDEYVIVFLAEGPGNSPPRPVKAISPETGLRVPRNVGGMAPPCEFTAPGPGLTVEIVTDTEQFNAENNISGDSPPEMPEVEFGSRVVDNNGDTDPSGITFEWTMELSYDEGNYEDFADSVLTLTETRDGDTSWQPDFSELPGNTPVGGNIEVTVNASQGQGQSSLSDTDVRDGYMIRGENPSSDTIVEAVPGSANDPAERRRGRLAMVWKESSGRQFDSNDQSPAFPLVSDDNGWGLTQLTDPEPTREQVWDWLDNVEEGFSDNRFEDNYSNTQENVENWYAHWTNQANGQIQQVTQWEWDPTSLNNQYQMKTEQEIEDIENLFESSQFAPQMQWLDQYWDDEFLLRDAADDPDPDADWVHHPVNSEREEEYMDGEEVSKILNMQAYLQFNAGPTFPAIVDEFGIIRRRINNQTWCNLTGDQQSAAVTPACNPGPGYVGHYDNQPWNN